MFSVKQILLIAVLLLAACGNNLAPSGSDMRATVTAGSPGYQPGQTAIDFTLSDSLGNPFTLSDHLIGGATPAKAVVLYFTMWCPICTSHMDHLLYTTIPQVTAAPVVYAVVDYVSGSVPVTRSAEVQNGYGGSAFTVLADSSQGLFNLANAAMGTTIVIDPYGAVLMNEDYRNGQNLANLLKGL